MDISTNTIDEAVANSVICIIDDEAVVRSGLGSLFRSSGYDVMLFESPADFLSRQLPSQPSCLVLDVQLHEFNGMDFQADLRRTGNLIPIVLMTGHGDIPMTVKGMKAGAIDFLAKPFNDADMLAAVAAALDVDRQRRAADDSQTKLRSLYEALSPREREVMGLVSAGLMNKQIAHRIGLSEITVKIHRGNLMKKMEAQSLADLVRMAEMLNVRNHAAARFQPSDTAAS
ncbi:response regulator transcription factor [Methylorubrum aminovorans]